MIKNNHNKLEIIRFKSYRINNIKNKKNKKDKTCNKNIYIMKMCSLTF